MNKLTIIGNLTRDPEIRETSAGIKVCDFTVAVNRRQRRDAQNSQPEADYFRVSVWKERAESCAKYLSKGKKVCVIGPVSVRTYTSERDGLTRASLEVTGDEVEFLSQPDRELSDAQVEDRLNREMKNEVRETKRMMRDIMDDELPF